MKSKNTLLSLVLAAGSLQAAEDIVLHDFESGTYSPWKTRGSAFGEAPSTGPLPGQMNIEGAQGSGFVSSFNGGDGSKGRLISPDFKIERNFITFLIGGGAWKEETSMNLVVNGKTVRAATGQNIRPGGSEKLSAAYWDVSEFIGREASIVIVDERDGDWGHINVDQIVLTNDKGNAAPAIDGLEPPVAITRKVRVTGDFLQLPLVRNPDRSKLGFQKLQILQGGKVERFMHVMFPPEGQEPDLWYSADVREFKGGEVTLQFASSDKGVLDRLEFSDKEHVDPDAYKGTHRPRFHFSPRVGWMNDVNGTYYHDGLYHLFYQFNPAATEYGPGFDMHWGHSVSKDLLHWEEWPIALFPNEAGQCFSGTTVMQHSPISGLNEGVKLPAPAMFFSGTEPFSQHLATTPDGGKTWERFSGNPVVGKMGRSDRDPKVIWHQPSEHYVMVLYVDGKGDTYQFLRSKDLKNWTTTSEIPGWFECPEFFPVKSPTTGEDLMLLYGCYNGKQTGSDEMVRFNSCYQLGRFDGKTFTPVSEIRPAHLGPNFYAALVFMNDPKGRQIMMGWGQNTRFPGEPFNQCASIPLEMKVKAIDGKDTLCYEPAEEVEGLRGKPVIQAKNLSAEEANRKLESLNKEDCYDVVVRFRQGDQAAATDVKIRGIHFHHDRSAGTLSQNGRTTKIHPNDTLDARILIDRGIVEAFWNGGEAAYAIASLHTDDGPALKIEGGSEIEELIVYPTINIWENTGK